MHTIIYNDFAHIHTEEKFYTLQGMDTLVDLFRCFIHKWFSSLLYYDRRVLLIYKAFWERNIEDSTMETSYLFLYYDISVEFYYLSSQLFKYSRIYPGKEA